MDALRVEEYLKRIAVALEEQNKLIKKQLESKEKKSLNPAMTLQDNKT